MSNSVRGNNSSPGIYFKETEFSYSAKSLGITALGVAGETLKGPAFEDVAVTDWSEYETVFGGTSTEKFRGSQYPKYELPFIAKSYLTESKQLHVVRVLGLSGYNAGPAWLIKDSNKNVIAVLRSRGHYVKYGQGSTEGECGTYDNYDQLVYDVKSIALSPYTTTNGALSCNTSGDVVTLNYFTEIALSGSDYGKFVIEATLQDNSKIKYAVSLNASDRDYIVTILGTNPSDGSAAVFVEELYDVALGQAIADATSDLHINNAVTKVEPVNFTIAGAPVVDILSIHEQDLRRGNIGQRFLADKDASEYASGLVGGNIYSVVYNTATDEYKYEAATGASGSTESVSTTKKVYVESLGRYVIYDDGVTEIVKDYNDYKERFRSAETPWFVSQPLGNGNNIEVKKLFRFVTISDGNSANEEVKVSIEKIYPDDGLFDVVVRDYSDSDTDPVVLEKFNKCSLIPEAASYIAKKIGTLNGEFELKSNYVMVDIAEDDTIYGLVPCGFLGYPRRSDSSDSDYKYYGLKYNTKFWNELRPRKQYFGMSDLVGVDIDVLRYKGKSVYTEGVTTNGFHLDSRMGGEANTGATILVNGESGFSFSSVWVNSSNGNGSTYIPVISTEIEMDQTIYSDINLRKFTAYFFGGYDAWDEYRKQRTNTDEFKANKYKGVFKYGESHNFTTLFDKAGLGLDDITAISSDYYAYLAAYRQFANPEAVDINLIATPGIDLINNVLLTDEVLNILEDDEDGRNGDALYVATAPDKPAGASDAESEMYTPSELADLIKDTEISDSYVATYYPWVKYFDEPSGTYIMLPPTKDVMRNFAYVDNHSAPWFAAAGTKEENGAVNCVKAHKFTKRQDENILYDNYVNPVKTFAKDGVKIWGNKTLYFNEESPLNRINVRRLMLRVKKLISGAGRVLVFDQNDGTLERQFRSIVEPILGTVRENRGITDYRLDILNSGECDAEHEINGKVWIKPTPTLEYIGIEFMITRTCVKFGV